MRNRHTTTFDETPIEQVARAMIYIYNRPEDRDAAVKRFEQAYAETK